MSSEGKSSGSESDRILERLVKMAVERGAEDTPQLRAFLALKAEFMADNLKEVDGRGELFSLSSPEYVGEFTPREDMVVGVDYSDKPSKTVLSIHGPKSAMEIGRIESIEVSDVQKPIRKADLSDVAELAATPPGLYISGRHSGRLNVSSVRGGPQGSGGEVRGALPEDEEDEAEGDGGVDRQQPPSGEEGEG